MERRGTGSPATSRRVRVLSLVPHASVTCPLKLFDLVSLDTPCQSPQDAAHMRQETHHEVAGDAYSNLPDERPKLLDDYLSEAELCAQFGISMRTAKRWKSLNF